MTAFNQFIFSLPDNLNYFFALPIDKLFLVDEVFWIDSPTWLHLKAYESLYSPTTSTVCFTIKVVLGICFLIVIRGGVPRYRYDFLTKLGWIKFLTLVLTLFVLTVTTNILF